MGEALSCILVPPADGDEGRVDSKSKHSSLMPEKEGCRAVPAMECDGVPLPSRKRTQAAMLKMGREVRLDALLGFCMSPFSSPGADQTQICSGIC